LLTEIERTKPGKVRAEIGFANMAALVEAPCHAFNGDRVAVIGATGFGCAVVSG